MLVLGLSSGGPGRHTPGVSLGCRLDSPWRVLGELFANYSEWPRLGPASTLDWTRHGEVFKSTHMIVSSTLTIFRHHHLQLILQIAKKRDKMTIHFDDYCSFSSKIITITFPLIFRIRSNVFVTKDEVCLSRVTQHLV